MYSDSHTEFFQMSYSTDFYRIVSQHAKKTMAQDLTVALGLYTLFSTSKKMPRKRFEEIQVTEVQYSVLYTVM